MVDICCFAVDLLEKSSKDHKSLQEEFNKTPVKRVADISGRNPFNAIEDKASLKSAIELMGKWKVHRIPVLDHSGELATLLTQTQILRFVHAYIADSPLGQKKITELKLIHTPVITMKQSGFIKDAFKLMTEHHISAVAIVDDSEKLVGALSVSDLKSIGLDENLFPKLFHTYTEFCTLYPKKGAHGPITGPIAVSPSATVTELWDKFSTSGVHRVFVMDDAQKLVGVISLTDLIDFLAECSH